LKGAPKIREKAKKFQQSFSQSILSKSKQGAIYQAMMLADEF